MIDGIIKGDSVEFECKINENVANWKIRCEIWDKSISIKKATSNTGGSDDQIEITDALNGVFLIKLDKGETKDIGEVLRGGNKYLANIEIEVETPDGKVYTVYRDKIAFIKERITWTTP